MPHDTSVDDSCISAFGELKAKRDINTVIYRLNDLLDTCVVERRGNLAHDELLRALPVDEPRLVLYALRFATVHGTRQNKVLLISWLPHEASPRHRTAYGHARAALQDRLDGSQVSVRAGEAADLAYHRLVSLARTGEGLRDASEGLSGPIPAERTTGAKAPAPRRQEDPCERPPAGTVPRPPS